MDSKLQMQAILESVSEEPFLTFLSDLLSSSEEKSSAASSMFEMMKQMHPDSLALKLLLFLSPSHDLHTRSMFALMLRDLVSTTDCRNHLTVSTQSSLKCILLDLISLQEAGFIFQLLLETVSHLVGSLLPDYDWPELLPFLYQLCLTIAADSNSVDTDIKKAYTFIIFATLAKDIGETTVPCRKDLRLLLLNVLNDHDNVHLMARIAATNAAVKFIQCAPSWKEKERFQDLLPGMMSTLTDSLRSNTGDAVGLPAWNVILFFIDLAKNEPRFLRTQLVVVVGSMLDIAEDKKLDERPRGLAVQFLITLVESREKAPGMMKRLPLFIDRCFAMLLSLLLDVKDDPAWHSAETLRDDTGATSNSSVGSEYLYRFSVALGGMFVAHIAIEQLSAYLAAPEWEKQHAALIALASIAQGFSKVMIKNLEPVVTIVLNCFQHSHPRVRWAACYAIATLLEALSPHLQEHYHNRLIPTIAKAADDFQNPRVQAFAVRALMACCLENKSETLIPYLDEVVNKLLVLLQNGLQMVQQEALRAFTFIAQCVGEHLQSYYDIIMPHLKAVLSNANLKSDLILRAKAIECISFVGSTGGKEKFREDAEQVMEVLISLQGLQVKGDDLPTVHLLMACIRICVFLGKEFLPYMSAVMPFIIEIAQLKPTMTELVESNRAMACFVLRMYAETLDEDFYPWIPQVVPVFIPLLKFYTHKNVRKYAVKAMYWLLLSAKLAVEKGIAQDESESYFAKLSDYIMQSLVEALHQEPTVEVCANMLNVLNDCLQICRPLLSESQLRRVVDELKHVIVERSNRKSKLKERAKSEDFDAEDELLREEKDQEDNIVRYVLCILHTLIETLESTFLPFFDELLPYLIPMWVKDMTVRERCTIYIIYKLLKVCPEAALKYGDIFLVLLLDATNDENREVREYALCGIVIYAECDGSVFKPFVRDAISRINVVILHFWAREPENEHGYYAAVCALGKIVQFHRESIDSSQVISIWLNCLPIKADMYEAKYVHDELCLMVERLDKELMGPNYQNLPKIISVFAEILCSEKDIATKETVNRIINVLRHLQQTLPPTIFESTLIHLLPQQVMEIKSILSLEEDSKS